MTDNRSDPAGVDRTFSSVTSLGCVSPPLQHPGLKGWKGLYLEPFYLFFSLSALKVLERDVTEGAQSRWDLL